MVGPAKKEAECWAHVVQGREGVVKHLGVQVASTSENFQTIEVQEEIEFGSRYTFQHQAKQGGR